MNIIAKNRGMGKTWDIVKRSIETGYPILCFHSADEMHMRNIAKQQGYDPHQLKVIICNRIDGKFDSKDYDVSQKYLIDESEYFLKMLLEKCSNGKIRNIDTMVINRENIINDNINIKKEKQIEKIKENIDMLIDLYSFKIKDKDCDYGKVLNILKNIDMLREQLKEIGG